MQGYSEALLAAFQDYYRRTKNNNFYPEQYEAITGYDTAIKELRSLGVLSRDDFIDGSLSFTESYLKII